MRVPWGHSPRSRPSRAEPCRSRRSDCSRQAQQTVCIGSDKRDKCLGSKLDVRMHHQRGQIGGVQVEHTLSMIDFTSFSSKMGCGNDFISEYKRVTSGYKTEAVGKRIKNSRTCDLRDRLHYNLPRSWLYMCGILRNVIIADDYERYYGSVSYRKKDTLNAGSHVI
jgi:hypothetical protein